VVGDLTASTGKLKQRAIGAFVGVPLGFLAGVALPPSRIGYALAVLAATLTLISFSRATSSASACAASSSRWRHPLPAAPAALRRSASSTC
jgi:uncharacterized membrane protein YccC